MIKKELFSNNEIPISINIIRLENIYNVWSEELKILYVLDGHITADNMKESFDLPKNNLFLLNTYDNFSLNNKGKNIGVFLEISINSIIINKIYRGFAEMIFDSFFCENDTIINQIKDYIGQLISITANEKENKKNLLIYKKVLELCSYLTENIRISQNSEKRIVSNKKYMVKILEFLEDNYSDENFTISKLSEYIGLTPQYILKLFRKSYGIGLIDYLNMIRVKKSLQELLYSNKSIVEIAIENGFNNSKIYHRIFKKSYNTTPGNYRKNSLGKELPMADYDELLKKLTIPIKKIDKVKVSNELVMVDVNISKYNKKSLTPYWKKVLALGKAFEGLKGEVQEQLRVMVSEIDFEYIKINCIFNDELYIFNEDDYGNIYYNYAYIDKLLDFFISLNLKPYINIGFMPKNLRTMEKYVLSSNVSYPNNMGKWTDLLKNMFSHFKDKYDEQVFSWKFEIWNNPNVSDLYWYESDEKFFYFFEKSFFAIKEVSQKFNVGGPTMYIGKNLDYIEKFAEQMIKKNIKLDFFSFNYYNMENKEININKSKEWHFNFYDYTTMSQFIKNTTNRIKTVFGSKIEIIVSEWNTSAYYLDLTHDTCYMSTFIIDTVLNNFNTVNALTYWTAIETRVGNGIFFGGLGLFTINSLKKASYNSFLLLNKLGNKLIAKGDNYFMSSKDENFQILLYNYVHYNEEYESGNFEMITLKDRYKAFLDNSPKELLLTIDEIPKGEYLIKKYFLNRDNGSVYDAWVKMGAPEVITGEIFEFLKSKEKMKLEIEMREISSKFSIKEVIKSHEVIFCDIIKK